jgi:hypothetical protein
MHLPVMVVEGLGEQFTQVSLMEDDDVFEAVASDGPVTRNTPGVQP